MRFTKMQGIGNDYIYLDLFELGPIQEQELPPLARAMSDRHFGVGSDGLVTIGPAEGYDCRMRMFNLDGSEGEMCGNALRCVALYMLERRGFSGDVLNVITKAGPRSVQALRGQDGAVRALRADMGLPRLEAEAIPTTAPDPARVSVTALGKEYRLFCVSMGNPHAVALVEDPEALDLPVLGPLLECAGVFPQKANIEFIRLRAGGIDMRVWERGSGETLACGTGACAAAVAAISQGLLPRRPVTLRLRGGELTIDWDEASGHVFMEGPAAFVFDGQWP